MEELQKFPRNPELGASRFLSPISKPKLLSSIDPLQKMLETDFITPAPVCKLLLEFMLHRPDWFAMTRTDIEFIRSCLSDLTKSSNPGIQIEAVSEFLKNVTLIVFSPEFELFVRIKDETIQSLKPLIKKSLVSEKRFKKDITRSLSLRFNSTVDVFESEVTVLSVLTKFERVFIEEIQDDYSIRYFQISTFLQNIMLRLCNAGQYDGIPFLLYLAQEKQIETFIDESYFGPVPNSFWLATHQLDGDTIPPWLTTLLTYLKSVYNKNKKNEVLKKKISGCLSFSKVEEMTLERIKRLPAQLPFMFKCISQLISDETTLVELPLVDNSTISTIGLLYSMGMIAHSPISVMIGFVNAPLRIAANFLALKYFVSDSSSSLTSIGLETAFTDYEIDVDTFKKLIPVFGISNSCLYWLALHNYNEWTVETQKKCLARVVKRLVINKTGIELLIKTGLGSYVERRMRDSLSWSDPLRLEIPGLDIKKANFAFTRELLVKAVAEARSRAGERDEFAYAFRKLGWRIATAFRGMVQPKNMEPTPCMSVLINNALKVPDAYVPDSFGESTVVTPAPLENDPITDSYLTGLAAAATESQDPPLPIFIEIFDHKLAEIALKERDYWTEALPLFRLALDHFPQFDAFDLDYYLIPRASSNETTNKLIAFSDWSGSMMGPRYKIIYDLVMWTWEYGEEEQAKRGGFQFNPQVIRDCFPEWMFDAVTGKPSWENFENVVMKWQQEPVYKYLTHHRMFLEALMYEHVWLPGNQRREGHYHQSPQAVTQLLYLLRMVSGVPAFLNWN